MGFLTYIIGVIVTLFLIKRISVWFDIDLNPNEIEDLFPILFACIVWPATLLLIGIFGIGYLLKWLYEKF